MPKIKQTLYRYSAHPVRAVDGDTIEVILDLGFNIQLLDHVRLFGLNTPELDGPEAERGQEAMDFTASWIAGAIRLYIESNKFNSREKYGRILATVFRDEDVVSLNVALVKAGLAK